MSWRVEDAITNYLEAVGQAGKINAQVHSGINPDPKYAGSTSTDGSNDAGAISEPATANDEGCSTTDVRPVRHSPAVDVLRTATAIQPVGAVAPASELTTVLKGHQWEDIEFFIDDHVIEIRVAGKSETRGYEAFGFQDKRTGKPNQQWAVLQVLGVCGGVIADDARHGKEWIAIAKRVERVRKALQMRFGRNDDPIPYEKDKGYYARFKISRVPPLSQPAR